MHAIRLLALLCPLVLLSTQVQAAPRLIDAYWKDPQVLLGGARISYRISGDTLSFTLPSDLSPAKIKQLQIGACPSFSGTGRNVPLINTSSNPKVIVPWRLTSIREVKNKEACIWLSLSSKGLPSTKPERVRLDFISGKTKKQLKVVIQPELKKR
ncbi:MAG: hypothetical protein ACPG4N_10585 [Gammaproteobacteria bacterium]